MNPATVAAARPPLCSSCHSRRSTRFLQSKNRRRHYCDSCEPIDGSHDYWDEHNGREVAEKTLAEGARRFREMEGRVKGLEQIAASRADYPELQMRCRRMALEKDELQKTIEAQAEAIRQLDRFAAGEGKADAPAGERMLSTAIATLVPARGILPLVVPPSLDREFHDLTSSLRSKIGFAVQQYLTGRQPLERARGVDHHGRTMFELHAGPCLVRMVRDGKGYLLDEFRMK